MSDWSLLRKRVAGKWQVPLFVLSLGLLAAAVFRFRPQPEKFPLPKAVEYLDSMVSGGLFERASDFAYGILAREGGSDAGRAPVYLALARAEWGKAQHDEVRTADAGRRIAEHYRFAAAHGVSLTPADLVHLGTVLEWQGAYRRALESYQAALEQGVEDSLDLRRRMFLLLRDRQATPPGPLDTLIDSILAEVGDDRLALRLWAMEQKIELLDELGRLKEAATLLVSNADRFKDTQLHDRFDYLQALLLYKTGHFDEAEAFLRTVRNRIDRTDDVDAMTGWLLGRVVLADGGPQRPLEALSFFQDVLSYHPSGRYAVASRLGMAEALGWMDRNDDAITSFRIAIEEWQSLGDNRLVNRDVVRTSLSVMAQKQRQEGRLAAGLDYLKLAVTLLDRRNVEQAAILLEQLAQLENLRAEELDQDSSQERDGTSPAVLAGSVAARSHYEAAAVHYVDLSHLNALNEQRSAAASWQAANLYTKAGQFARAVELYRAFTVERPSHSLVPRALLRIGQILQATGKISQAVEAYQACYRRFPRTLDGSRALVPLAQCYLTLGPGDVELAEKTLRIVLNDSEVFTPKAPEFADALFLLGDILNRREQNEKAIAMLEEVLQRYPDDPRATRAHYLLADSYRRSALALKRDLKEITAAGELEKVRGEVFVRFAKARELYRRLITDYEVRGTNQLNRLERMYLRQAHFYEADCYFDAQDYRTALTLYEDAVAMFRSHPISLAGYVQIINCYVFLGEKNEARAALARAIVLTGAISESAFSHSVSPEARTDWNRYFQWLGRSKLFS